MEKFIEGVVRIIVNSDRQLSQEIRELAISSHHDEFGLFELINEFYSSKITLYQESDDEEESKASVRGGENIKKEISFQGEWTSSFGPNQDTQMKAATVYNLLQEWYGNKGFSYYSVFKKLIELLGVPSIIKNFEVSYTEDLTFEFQEIDVRPKVRKALHVDISKICKYISEHDWTDSHHSVLTSDLIGFLNKAMLHANSEKFSKRLEYVELTLLSDEIKNFLPIILDRGDFTDLESVVGTITGKIKEEFIRENNGGSISSATEFYQALSSLIPAAEEDKKESDEEEFIQIAKKPRVKTGNISFA